MPTRRNFLALSAAAAASAFLPRLASAEIDRLGGPVFSNASVGAYEQGILTLAHFQKLVGSDFKVFLDHDEVAWLHLREAVLMTYAAKLEDKHVGGKQVVAPAGADLALGRNPVQPESFQLRFDISGPAFPQDSYLLDHGTLGRFVAFLLPGSTPDRCYAPFCSFPAGRLPLHAQPIGGGTVCSALGLLQ